MEDGESTKKNKKVLNFDFVACVHFERIMIVIVESLEKLPILLIHDVPK